MKKTPILAAVILLILLLNSAAVAYTEKDEIAIGREVSHQIETKYKLYEDTAALRRVIRIGSAISQVSARPYLPYSFKILDTDKINAMATPGGFVYVTKGLLKMVSDEELAFVLGHEITHAAKGHWIKQVKKSETTAAGLLLISALINRGRINRGNINTVKAASIVLKSGYARKDETEADVTACHYMVEALNISPRYGVKFLKKLKKTSGEMPEFLNGIIGDHPLLDERIKRLEEECESMGY